MKNFPSYPLQTDRNCAAYAFATAIELALEEYAPEFWQRVDRAAMERLIGAPVDLRVAAARVSEAMPWVRAFEGHTLAFEAPLVVATWRDGFSHAICLVSHTHEYDPGKGVVQEIYGEDKMNTRIVVRVVNPPVANRWRRYALYRWLEDLFN
jgi:hypothetical protein